MTNLDHIVLTRFNVRLPGVDSRPSEEWLRKRLELFENYTARSFANQSETDFRWLVFFDSDTPKWARREVDRIRCGAQGELFHAVYVDGVFNPTIAARVVAEHARGSHLVTTRCDNDDAVARDFVATIQRNVRPNIREFINLVDGAQMGAGRVCRRPYTSNPFISLSEPLELGREPQTVFVGQHDMLRSFGPLRNVRTESPMWLQVVHGDNLANELVGLTCRSSRFREHYSVELPPDPQRFALRIAQVRDAFRILARVVTRWRRLIELMRWLRSSPSVGE